MDRRRTSRFVIPEHAQGMFRVMQDVYIQQVDTEGVLLLLEQGLTTGEELIVELPPAIGPRLVVNVTVVNSIPVWIGEVRRHRVATRSVHPIDVCRATPALKRQYLGARPVLPALGILIRRLAVRVRDVSTAGCLLESAEEMAEGTVGQLEVGAGGEMHREPLRVCRSTRVAGSAWPWRSGARFLGIEAPAPASVRNIAARFEIIDELERAPLLR
jgi:hypothetical protein